MPAWWSGSAGDFLATPPDALRRHLAAEAARRFRLSEFAQLRAWEVSIGILRNALDELSDDSEWRVVLEFGIVRLGMRADAILVCARGVLVLEFKIGASGFDNAARRQVEAYAVDLQDFHAGSRGRPIVPVLIASEATASRPILPLLLGGAMPVVDATPMTLGPLIRDLSMTLPAATVPIDVTAWEHAPYRPVPGIIDAACHLFARHDVAEIATARADATNLTLTIGAVDRLLAGARAAESKIVVFVTGIPGAGKTLCGLGIVFARGTDRTQGAAFLTGNPTLVHVLREALVRDAVRGGHAEGCGETADGRLHPGAAAIPGRQCRKRVAAGRAGDRHRRGAAVMDASPGGREDARPAGSSRPVGARAPARHHEPS